MNTISIAIALSIVISILLFFFEAESKQLIKSTTLVDKNIYSLSGPFGHKNLFSSYLVLCIPFLGLMLFFKNKLVKTFSISLIIAVIILLFVLKTKSAFLGLCVGFVVLLFPMIKLIKTSRPKAILKLNIALVVFAVTSGLVIYFYYDFFSLLFQTDSLYERLATWDNSLKMIADYPYGVGGGNWQVFFPKYGLNAFYEINETVYNGYQTFQRPHNDFIWILSEAGFGAFIAYIAVFLFAFLGLYKQLNQAKNISEKLKVYFIALALISYFVISFFDFPLERNEHQLIFVILLTLSVPVKTYSSFLNKKMQFLALSVILFISIFSVTLAIKRIENEKHHLVTLKAHRTSNWSLMIRQGNKIDQSVLNMDNFSIPISWYTGVAYFSKGNLSRALENFTNAYKTHPYQIHVINNLAGLYNKTKEYKKAIAYYDKALEIASKHPEVLLNKSITYFKMNEHEKAFYSFIDIKYSDQNTPLYHNAMKTIFNSYIDLKIDDTENYKSKSLSNIRKSDSLKAVIIYHYQEGNKNLNEMLNFYNY